MIVRKSVKMYVLIVLIIAVILSVTLGLYFGLSNKKQQGGVVTNGYECAEIASDILNKGGTAVDAAIAALFCEGIAMPQSMGLGGGFLMTIYTKSTGKIETLNAREVAPLAAHTHMFNGNASLALKGGLSIAVPGELKGYWYAHQKYGRLKWEELVRPAIELCRRGHVVTAFLAQFFANRKEQLMGSESLQEVFINSETNDTYKEGDFVKREKLGETLEVVAKEGADALYNGSLTETFVKDIRDNGGIITTEDLNNYKPEWLEPISIELNDEILHTFPVPGSGPILAFIFNVLKQSVDNSELDTIKNWQRIVETFKYAYAKRTELGDQNFVEISDLIANLTSDAYAALISNEIQDDTTFQDPVHYGANVTSVEDHGTAHISILAPNGDAVSVTSTIVQYFGSDIRSKSTGIILNDEMDNFASPNITNDFGVPPSPANYIEPGKRPMSSMCPTIIVDKKSGDVKMVVGAAGGTKITTSVALVIMRHLWFDETLIEAVSAKRLHHQLFPMRVEFEFGFNDVIVDGLKEIGHNYTISSKNSGFSALTALSRANDGTISAVFDPRRPGRLVIL